MDRPAARTGRTDNTFGERNIGYLSWLVKTGVVEVDVVLAELDKLRSELMTALSGAA